MFPLFLSIKQMSNACFKFFEPCNKITIFFVFILGNIILEKESNFSESIANPKAGKSFSKPKDWPRLSYRPPPPNKLWLSYESTYKLKTKLL